MAEIDDIYRPNGITSYDDQNPLFVTEADLIDFMNSITIKFTKKDRIGDEGHYDFVAEFRNSDGSIDVLDSFYSFTGHAFYLGDVGITMETALIIARGLEKRFPDLDNKLVFFNEHSELARFKFGLSDEELYKRIGLESDYIDYGLMLELDLIDPDDIPLGRHP